MWLSRDKWSSDRKKNKSGCCLWKVKPKCDPDGFWWSEGECLEDLPQRSIPPIKPDQLIKVRLVEDK